METIEASRALDELDIAITWVTYPARASCTVADKGVNFISADRVQ